MRSHGFIETRVLIVLVKPVAEIQIQPGVVSEQDRNRRESDRQPEHGHHNDFDSFFTASFPFLFIVDEKQRTPPNSK